MLIELAIFAAFFGCSLIAEFLHQRKHRAASHLGLAARLAFYYAILLKALPIAFHEYIAHLLVYSGYVIKH